MTTYTWPDTRAMRPRGWSLYPAHNTRRAVSALNGTVQSGTLPGARWLASMDWPDQRRLERAQIEALINRLNGGEHRLALWDLDRPQPLGNIGVSGVTASAASQFATSLTLNGTLGRNLLRYTRDLRNTSEAGGTRPWTEYDDTGDAVQVVLATYADPFGTGSTVSRLQCNSTSTVQRQVSQSFSAANETIVTGSVHAHADQVPRMSILMGTRDSLYPGCHYNLAGGALAGAVTNGAASPIAYGMVDLGGGWYRCWVQVSVRTGATTPTINIQLRNTSNGGYGGAVGDGIYLDGAQVEVGALTDFASVATLLAGDRIGVPISTGSGSQLLEVAQDCAATDAGVITVPLHTQLRGSVTGGASVTLDKPTALFIPAGGPIAWPRGGGGISPGIAFDLEEVFA